MPSPLEVPFYAFTSDSPRARAREDALNARLAGAPKPAASLGGRSEGTRVVFAPPRDELKAEALRKMARYLSAIGKLNERLRLGEYGLLEGARFRAIANSGNELARADGARVWDLDDVRGELPFVVLHNHDPECPVGLVDEVGVTDDGLEVRGGIFDNGPGHALRKLVGAGDTFRCSVTSLAIKRKTLAAGKRARVNGRLVEGPLTIVRRWRIEEMSFVEDPADPDTAAWFEFS